MSVLLVGEVQARPRGLEVALARAGMHVAEADDPAALPHGTPAPDVVLATLRDPAGVAAVAESLGYAFGPALPLVVTLATAAPDAAIRALRAGATDALAEPINLAELCLRLQLRRGSVPRSLAGSPGLDDALQFATGLVASERVEDVLQQLCYRVATTLELQRCAFVLTTGNNGHGRVIADDRHAGLLDLDLDLARYPEIQEARRTGEPVVIRDTRTDPRFDVVRRHWGQSPPAGMPHALATVPVRLDGRVAGVFLLRAQPQPAGLPAAPFSFAADLEQAASAALRAGENHPASGLRGLATSRELEARMHAEVERARRYSLGFSLVLLEADGLDLLRVSHGEEVADALLGQLADLLRETFRVPDLVARYGATEFALLLPETAAAQALGAVRRFRVRLARQPEGDAGFTLSVAAGIAGFPHPAADNASDVLALAGGALLRARAQSGERIGVAEVGTM